MKVQNVKRLNAKLKKLAKPYAGGNAGDVIVGYTANYAMYVHEDLKARHKEGKVAKYLEKPARELSDTLGSIVAKIVASGGTLIQGLYAAGFRLQRESQQIVPIDTSNLKNSAFTREVK